MVLYSTGELCLVLSVTVQYRLVALFGVIFIVIFLVLALVFCYKIIWLCCAYCGIAVLQNRLLYTSSYTKDRATSIRRKLRDADRGEDAVDC